MKTITVALIKLKIHSPFQKIPNFDKLKYVVKT